MITIFPSSALLVSFVTGWLAAADGSPANWPQWRGPGGRGVSSEIGFPQSWGEGHNLLWKAAVPGRGHSSPVVWGDRIFVTSAVEVGPAEGADAVTHFSEGKVYHHPDSVGGDRVFRLLLICLDRASGEILWTTTLREGTPFDDRHRRNTYASGTPVTDGRHVWVFFEAEGLYCVNFDGMVVWRREIGQIAKAGMGPGTSPVLFEDLIILQCDQQGNGVSTDPARPTHPFRDEESTGPFGEGSFILALDSRTGREVWRSRRDSRRSWATPVIVQTSSGPQLITSSAEATVAYEPRSGRQLWRAPGVRSHPIPSPVYNGEVVVVSAGSGRKHALGIRFKGEGSPAERLLWHYRKGTAYVVSPILYGDYLYLVSNVGVITCLDPLTGEVIYDDGRLPPGARFWSSPVAFEGRILVSDDGGNSHVFRAGPRFEILASNKIEEPIWASPALSGGQIFIRGDRSLYAFAQRSAIEPISGAND